MKNFRRLLSSLMVFAMFVSMLSAAPVFAAESAAENQSEDITMYRTKDVSVEITALTEEEKAAALLGKTNLIDNGGFESSQDISDWSKYGTVSVSVSDKQAYEGSYSMLINGKGAANAYTYKNASGFRPGATYIMSAMVLGTENNADAEPDYDDRWINKFSMMLSGTNSALAESIYHNEILPRNLSSAPLSTAEEQSKLPPSEWKQLFGIIETKEDVNEATLIGPSVYCGYLGLEYYVDNYYVGELIVSNVENTTASDTIQIPLSGQSPAQLNLTAQAYNQLGTTDCLGDCTYDWKLNCPVDGVSVDNGVLTVTDEAQVGDIALTVTCTPGFTGADSQTSEQKQYRSKDVKITLDKLTEAEKLENLRASTNLYVNAGLEDSDIATSSNTSGWWTNRYGTTTLTAVRSDKQAYSGKYSLLNRQTENIGDFKLQYVYTGKLPANKTYVSSAAVLGTKYNETAVNTDRYTGLKGYDAHFSLYAYGSGGNVNVYNGITSNSSAEYISMKTMLEVPASDVAEQVKVGKDKWQIVDNYFVIGETSPTYAGTGIRMNGAPAEVYVDDYYLGELIVAAVRNTSETSDIFIPEAGNTSDLTLSAQAVNQLGNSKYLGDVTYTWAFADGTAPEGVSLEGNVLTVTSDAAPGKVKLSVTATPSFTGADAQTDAQKALRTSVVTVNIKASKGFDFAIADGKVTPTAYIVNGIDGESVNVYSALYKVVDGIDTLMDFDSKTLKVTDGEGKATVALKAFEIPSDYEYKVKCFMWKADDSLAPVIVPAIAWN